MLDAEVERWSAKSCEQLEAELAGGHAYEVNYETKPFQVEVQILESAPSYVHVAVAVDDGSLPASFRPLTRSFVRQRDITAETRSGL